jgi:hypothetical protein
MQGLQRKDREDARHQVKQHPPASAPKHCDQDCLSAEAANGAPALRDFARSGSERKPAPVAKRQYARQPGWRRNPCLEARNQSVAIAAEGLRRGIVDHAGVGRKNVGLAEGDAGGEREGDFDAVAGTGEARRAAERARECAAPFVEAAVAGRQAAGLYVERDLAAFGNTYFVGTGEPVELGADRDGSSCTRRDIEPHEDGMIALVDVVHEPGDGEAARHRIA